MIDRDRIIPVATVLLIGMIVTTPFLGLVDGQILTEKTYYENDFEQHRDKSVQLVADSELQNQFLTETSNWTGHTSEGVRGEYGPKYGSEDAHNYKGHIDTRQPWFSYEIREYEDHPWFGVNRTLNVPTEMSNPVLVVEHADYRSRSSRHTQIAVDNQIYTTRSYDSSALAHSIEQSMSPGISDWKKVGYLDHVQSRGWTSSYFQVDSSKQNVTLRYATRTRGGYRNWHSNALDIRNLYWVDASSQAFSGSIDGYESVPEDDSFGGPDPYSTFLITKPTAEGLDTSMWSSGQTIRRDFNVSGISTKPQKAYFEIDATSKSNNPINWRIEQYGQEIASGTIDAQSSAQDTAEVNFQDDEFTLVIESGGRYEIHDVSVVALEETSAGDPLASEGPFVLDAQQGYDQTVGVFIDLLDFSTTTLLYIVMIALAIGAVAFSYTKSVRGQEFGQSMMFGAIIAGIVIVGMVPTMNVATWIFTGDTQRAPLANPSLEAEPPTYYSTEFQAGTMDGWDGVKGMARPVSAGEGFNLQMTADGQSAVIQRKVHISLGNSLDTGFVRLGATASSTPGYTSNPHETSVRVRVYVTDGEEPTWASKTTDLTDEDLSTYDDLVVAQEWARSFDGQVVNQEGTITFPLEGDTIYVEVIATDNRNDELATGSLNWVAVGATTEGTGEAAGGH